jgi:exopolyphosphatase/guanosine-5'-triphosphate,3'-diphosphate pyrophosphatase
MGAVRLTEGYLPSNPPTGAEINAAEAAVKQVLQIIPKPDAPLMLVASGGTAANLAGMWLAATGQPVNVNTIHGVRLDRCTVSDFMEQLAVLPWADRRETPGLEPARADVIVAGALLQVLLMEHLNVGELIVSARGLRYGLLYELLDGGMD